MTIPKHQVVGGLSNSDLKFIKSYSKVKKSYDNKGVLVADKYDCEQRQAPNKTFLKVDRKDYSFAKHCKKIRRTLPGEQANDLIKEVIDINEFTEAKMLS